MVPLPEMGWGHVLGTALGTCVGRSGRDLLMLFCCYCPRWAIRRGSAARSPRQAAIGCVMML